jgi:hypothetical protein
MKSRESTKKVSNEPRTWVFHFASGAITFAGKLIGRCEGLDREKFDALVAACKAQKTE